MLHSIVKIQKVWRGFSCRKKLKKFIAAKKPKGFLSIENSLFPIKDFTPEKRKEKHFNFKEKEILWKKSIRDDIVEKKTILHSED